MDLFIYLIMIVVLMFKLPVSKTDGEVITDTGYTRAEIMAVIPIGNNLDLVRDLGAFKKIVKEMGLIV
jgi:hypothetical protein